MPDFIRKRSRRRRPSPQREKRKAARTASLIIAGRQLLAGADYDRISVAQFAARARCSVGTFYGRFRDKNAFIDRLIEWTFNNEMFNAERELDAERWQGESGSAVAQQIVRYFVLTMTGETAGIARAALKRGQVELRALDCFLAYRSAVTAHAVKLLKDRLPKSHRPKVDIGLAMQLAQATVIDSLLNDLGPLETGSHSMIAALSGFLMRSLGLEEGPLETIKLARRQPRKAATRSSPRGKRTRRIL